MVVVSWLVEVADEFGLQQESLHAAVGLLDRFLATSAVREGGGLLSESLTTLLSYAAAAI
jgi:hypothetical protein